jgi:pimeloyl-ACP methyl ester carboxylesterase
VKQISVNDTTLHVLVEGHGPPLLLVHGFPLDHTMWRYQIEAFSGDFRVFAPDLRGFGQNAPADGTLTMEQFADDLDAALDAFDVVEPVTLCGLSMGGYIAFAFLRRHADRLERLILCDTKAAADDEAAIERRKKLAAAVLEQGSELAARDMPAGLFAPQTLDEDPDLIEGIRETIRQTPPSSIAAASLGMAARPDSTPLLDGIAVPTLVLVGAHDQLTGPDEMRSVAEQIPESRFEVIPDAGHMAPLENPETVNEIIESFLSPE